jgi:hypothetical protein
LGLTITPSMSCGTRRPKMSRFYQIDLMVHGKVKEDEVKEAARGEWGFEDHQWYNEGELLLGSGQGNICGGVDEKDLALKIARAVWKANGSYCKVSITATYLQELPSDTYLMTEDEYHKYAEDD